MKINLKEEKGSITVFVVSMMVFMMTILGITYMNVLNKLTAEEKRIDRIQSQYRVDNLDEKYQRAVENLE